MENPYQLVSVILLALLLIAYIATNVMLGFFLGRSRTPQVYVQAPPYPTASTGTGNYAVTAYTWKAPEPEQAAVWPEKKPDPPCEDTSKSPPSCYCCNCGLGLFGDPTNQLLIDEVSYLVYACAKCNDVTLKPLRIAA